MVGSNAIYLYVVTSLRFQMSLSSAMCSRKHVPKYVHIFKEYVGILMYVDIPTFKLKLTL
jgi:hypothetical protein